MDAKVKTIDLNVDVGELPSALANGSEERLLRLVSSANIACGGHAGDAASMKCVVGLCLAFGVNVGAHPGYPDKPGFGRTKVDVPLPQLEASLREQLESLVNIAINLRTTVRHVKPHGALYNEASRNRSLARCIARAALSVDNRFILLGLAGSLMLEVWKEEGFAVVAEAFADRRYDPGGSLRERRHPDAVITDPAAAADQALSIARDGLVVAVDGSRLRIDAQTICIHGDTKNASAIAAAVRKKLEEGGVTIRAF